MEESQKASRVLPCTMLSADEMVCCSRRTTAALAIPYENTIVDACSGVILESPGATTSSSLPTHSYQTTAECQSGFPKERHLAVRCEDTAQQ